MKSTTKFEESSENSDEAARRAAAADQTEHPFEPELVDAIPGQEPQFTIDPSKMHALMVRVVKGIVQAANRSFKWDIEPEADWYDTTTEALDIVLEKWLGTMATSPEALLAFNLSMGWILPNLLMSMDKPKEEPKESTELHVAHAV